MSLWSKDAERLITKKYLNESAQYIEFKSFYSRLLSTTFANKNLHECISFLAEKLTKIPTITMNTLELHLKNITELSLIHMCILLFSDYTSKKLVILKAKIQKLQSSLPVYSFKDKIIHTLQLNNVVLIAADTGAGKDESILKCFTLISQR